MSSAAHVHRCVRALAATLAVSIAGVVATPLSGSATPRPTSAVSIFAPRPESTAGSVQTYINAHRRRVGAGPVALQWQLNVAAQRHAVEMAQRRYMTHTGANGSNAGTRISAMGYRWWIWGENVAAGQTTPSQLVWSWLSSPSHKDIMLDRRYRHMGLGWSKGSNGVIYWCLLLASPL